MEIVERLARGAPPNSSLSAEKPRTLAVAAGRDPPSGQSILFVLLFTEELFLKAFV